MHLEAAALEPHVGGLDSILHEPNVDAPILLLDTLYHEFTSTQNLQAHWNESIPEADEFNTRLSGGNTKGKPPIWTREAYIEKVRATHPKHAEKIKWCGNHGPKRIASGNSNKLIGARCDCGICDMCAPIRARKNAQELIAVVDNLILDKGVNPDRIVVGRFTMSNHHHTPKEQVDLLSDTVNRARDMSWWEAAIDGDEETLHTSGSNRINVFLYILLVIKPNADLEEFKRSCFGYFQKRIGTRLVQWDTTPEQWHEWLKPANIKPDLFYFMHSNLLMAGHDFWDFFHRSKADLNQLIPCYSNRDSVSRGGVIADVRKELGFNCRQKKTVKNQKPSIPIGVRLHKPVNSHLKLYAAARNPNWF